MKKTILAGILGSFLSMSLAQAGDVNVTGRTYSYSCGYYSSQAGDFRVDYHNQYLPWGTRVFFVYGWGGYDVRPGNEPRANFDWADRAETEVSASGPYTWTFNTSKTIQYRSSMRFIQKLQFVIRVQLPDGRQFYELGSRAPWGYFETSFYTSSVSDCVRSADDLPAFKSMSVSAIEK